MYLSLNTGKLARPVHSARQQEHWKRGISPASRQRPDDASLQESLYPLLVALGHTSASFAGGERPLTDPHASCVGCRVGTRCTKIRIEDAQALTGRPSFDVPAALRVVAVDDVQYRNVRTGGGTAVLRFQPESTGESLAFDQLEREQSHDPLHPELRVSVTLATERPPSRH